MDMTRAPIGGAEQMIVCPNCGNRRAVSGVDSRCDTCGALLDPAGSGQDGIASAPIPGQTDLGQVPPPMVAGGIGGASDGTQVTHHVSTAVPGKPMAPIADDPAEGAAGGPVIGGPAIERSGGG